MSLFDRLVDDALAARDDLAVLRPVVEKELLHHDIMRELAEAGLLARLVFIGGTCLRTCYGSPRLSEDLDFTGGADFRREDLAGLGETLTKHLMARYGHAVSVGEPVKTGAKVSTWKLRIETRPERPDLPAQRIHIDVCAIPSHDPRPMMLRNLYGIEMGTSGLILRAQSREEIFADKLVALAFRENRVKNRDLWDIAWLRQQGVEPRLELLPKKLDDHHREAAEFIELLRDRVALLLRGGSAREDFIAEMRRFLPVATVRTTIENPDFWTYLTRLVAEESEQAIAAVK